MRPIMGTGGESTPARKPSISGDTSASVLGIGGGGLTSFMLASEAELDRRETSLDSSFDSTYGIQSIADEPNGSREDEQEEDTLGTLKPNRRLTALRMLDTNTSSDTTCAAKSHDLLPATFPDTSQPITPISFASHAFESSVPSSPKSISMRSFQHSDDDLDGASSNAIASSEDEGALEPPPAFPDGPSQQLIMPSLIMPSRRPFTERGRGLGNIKIMVAGSSRVGKTSLIKSIIRSCGDIIHVDAASLRPLQASRASRHYQNPWGTVPTTQVTEVYASTRARPSWWSDLDGSEDQQRRRSIDENVLSRNLCFVDTPGFNGSNSLLEGTEATLKYLEKVAKRSIDPKEQTTAELLALLSGDGGSLVDAVLYLVDHDLTSTDIEYIRQLNQLSSVIPLLAKADSLDNSTLSSLKGAVAELLSSSGIILPAPPSHMVNGSSPPFTVCSCPSTDLEAMDASVLMQSECVQPSVQSELNNLIDLLFEPNNVRYFKHMAATKALAYRDVRRGVVRNISPCSTLAFHGGSTATSSSMVTMRPSVYPILPNYRSDQAPTDPRTAQLRLVAWASSLQRSLAHERRRYERLAQGERLAWLRAQLDAYDDLDVPEVFNSAAKGTYHQSGALLPLKRSSAHHTRGAVDRDSADPLGILRFRCQARQTTWMVFQIASGCGILSAAVIWALHRWAAIGGTSVLAVPPPPATGEDWTRGWWTLNDDNGLLERPWAWLR